MRRLLLILCFIPNLSLAQEARLLGDNPAVEARLKTLALELRCLVCQNQTLADSNAPLAEDLRREVREMISKDLTDEQIMEFLVTRYGDFIRYRPPLKLTTLFLWVGPFILLALGALTLALSLRRRASRPEEATLSTEDRSQLARLLESEKGATS